MCYSFVVGAITNADPMKYYSQNNVLWAFIILGPTINHSCNFIVYVMSNKAFRDEFTSMVKNLKKT